MAQPSAPLLDLRQVRTTFLPKSISYALSHQYKVHREALYALRDDTVVLRLASRASEEQQKQQAPRLTSAGQVFTVRGDKRVPGLDGLGHETPSAFHVCSVSEAVTMQWRERKPGARGVALSATIQGRMVFESPFDAATTDREPIRICLTYDGCLQVAGGADPKKLAAGVPLQATAYLATFFEISLAEYHWLTETASIAYGTWRLSGDVAEASFDVYLVT